MLRCSHTVPQLQSLHDGRMRLSALCVGGEKEKGREREREEGKRERVREKKSHNGKPLLGKGNVA